jgi:hypothetical protein
MEPEASRMSIISEAESVFSDCAFEIEEKLPKIKKPKINIKISRLALLNLIKMLLSYAKFLIVTTCITSYTIKEGNYNIESNPIIPSELKIKPAGFTGYTKFPVFHYLFALLIRYIINTKMDS